MQKLANETKTVNVRLTLDQYQYLVTLGGTRGVSASIRAILDEAINQKEKYDG